MQPSYLRLTDGRWLAYCETGPPTGAPVLVCHGMPNSRLELLEHTDMLDQIGIRLLTVDRPGYGQSDPSPSSRVVDVSADLRQLIVARGVAPVTVLGISAGGPYALGLAAHAPAEVRRVGLLSSLGPVSSRTSRRGMNAMNRTTFALARVLPRPVVRRLVEVIVRSWRRDPLAAFDRLAAQFAPPDRHILAGMREHGANDLAEAIAHGGAGLAGDVTRLVRDWGFTLDNVHVPVDMWHGTEDRNVPPSHAWELSNQLTDARLNVVPGEGHLAFEPRMEHLLARMTETRSPGGESHGTTG